MNFRRSAVGSRIIARIKIYSIANLRNFLEKVPCAAEALLDFFFGPKCAGYKLLKKKKKKKIN